MIYIETERLIIRNFKAEDGQGLYETIQTYVNSPFGKFDHKWPDSREEIQGVAGWFAQGDGFLAVCLKDTGQFIGFIAFNKTDAADAVVYDLGYVFNAAYQGHGYATEGCRAVLEYGFDQLGVQRLVSGTAEANQASMRLLQKLGFHVTRRMRGSMQQDEQGNPIEFDGCELQMTREAYEQAKSTHSP